jgi:hypothetical protein
MEKNNAKKRDFYLKVSTLDLTFYGGLCILHYKWDGEPVRRLSKGSRLFFREESPTHHGKISL